MKKFNLNQMIKGWFVGKFEPTVYSTNACEVAVKFYSKESYEERHYHKVATEITVIVEGKVRMFDAIFVKGDIIVAEPGDVTSFTALEDTINVVVKIPGENNDKYIMEEKRC